MSIIALSGYAKCGKDTVAQIMTEIYNDFKIKKFSGKLKLIAGILTGIEPYQFDNQSIKEMKLEGWGMTVRELLQKIGTDAIRDGLHSDAWVNALFCDYHQGDHWVITDCRFKNEAIAVKEFGGVIVRIERDGVGPVNSHPSEVDLDDWKFDYVLKNNGTLDELSSNVFIMMLNMFGKFSKTK